MRLPVPPAFLAESAAGHYHWDKEHRRPLWYDGAGQWVDGLGQPVYTLDGDVWRDVDGKARFAADGSPLTSS